MKTSVAIYVARRLNLTGGGNGNAGPGVVIAVAGIALAVTVMLLSIAIMRGFKNEIRAKVTGFESQITLSQASPDGDIGGDISNDLGRISMSDTLKLVIDASISDAEVTLAIVRPGVIKTSEDFAGVIFRADDGGAASRFVGNHVIAGSMPGYQTDSLVNSIVLSRRVADRLDLSVGDKADAYFFVDGNMKARRLNVAAIYETHFGDYDEVYVVSSPSMLRRLDRLDCNMGTRIEINGLATDEDIEPAARLLQQNLLEAYYDGTIAEVYQVDNVNHRGALYLNWLSLLDTNVTVILALMGAVAAFTLISSLFIIILDRVNMIGILKALGATNMLIRRTFILVAERLVVKGLIIGNIVGLGLIAMQRFTHLIPLNPEAYYLDSVPVEINFSDIVILNIAVVVVAAIVLVLPSHIVAGISPSKSIRYD